jgi:Tat protein translocase TatB subunit
MTLAFIFSDVGAGEWFVLLAVILIVMGPKRLPETARKFGHYYSKFRRAAESFKRQLLEMDTEINTMVSDVEKEATNAFTVEDDFSSHSDSGEAFEDESDPYAAYGREAYGDYATDGPSQPDDTPPESAGSQPEPAEAPAVAEAGTPAEPTAQEPVKEA